MVQPQNILGACSWSLQPASPADLAERLGACGLSHVQLALGPLCSGHWDPDETRRTLAQAGIGVPSAMIAMRGEDYSTIDSIRETGGLRPDAHWPANLDGARRSAEIAHALSIPLVTFHAGFIPESRDDPLRERMVERIVGVGALFAERGIGVALETGQESAGALLDVLADPRLAGVRISFDPANMILYGSADPIEALSLLAPRVAQIHLKDALPARTPGAWGTETPLGRGGVEWPRFFRIVRDRLAGVPLLIERESGERRVADIRLGADLARRLGGVRWPRG